MLVTGLYAAGWLSGVERVIKDADALLMRHEVRSDVVLIDIDASSLRQLNTWPWPRRYHAQLLDQLKSASPALVVFDIDFSSESNPVDDAEFARALAEWEKERVVLVAFLQYADASKDSILANYPIQPLRKHARTASINIFPSEDGLVRKVSLRDSDHPPNAPALAKVLYEGGNVPADLIINYSIDPGSITHFSYADIISGRFDPSLLKGKKIIVGATAIELRDQVAVPVYRVLPGPVIQALAYESLRSGAVVVAPMAGNILMLLVFGAIIIALMCRVDNFPRLWNVVVGLALIYCAALAARWVINYQVDAFPFMLFSVLSYLVRQVANIDRQVISGLAQMLLIKRKQNQIDAINRNALEGILSVNTAGEILSINPACGAIFSCTLASAVGRPVSDYFPGLAIVHGQALLNDTYSPKGRFELAGVRGTGERFFADISIEMSTVDGRELDPVSMVFVQDISPLKQKQEMLEFQATHDPLTRLLNKSGLLDAVEADVAGHSNGKQAALLVIGVKSVSAVNHELGYAAGESLLKIVADRLVAMSARRSSIRLSARIATDEFCVWVEGDSGAASIYAEDIAKRFEDPVVIDNVQVDVVLAIGIAIYPSHAETAPELLRRASFAMRDVATIASPVRIFNDASSPAAMRKLTLASQLREAIASNGLALYYQPKLDTRTNVITSVEALARWRHADLGFISPDEFIHVAEESGVIKQLTAWAIETAIHQHACWLEQGIDLRIAVNISSKLLSGDVLLEILDKALTVNPLIASALSLEITESAIMDQRDEALALLGCLSERGFRLSLDDFGTGQSSFAYLKDLPVQELKIDKAFVMSMDTQPKDAQIVSSIISLAHGLGLEVVAEGIESQAILALLTNLRCEYGQGYWIGKPMPAHELTAQLMPPAHQVLTAR